MLDDENFAIAAEMITATSKGKGLRHSSGRMRNNPKNMPANTMTKL